MPKNKIIIPGFQFSGIHCGIKDSGRKKDLTLIYSEEPKTVIDGVFTTNKVVAAPVILCRSHLAHGKGRLIVINSGIANACTGVQGMRDAKKTLKTASKLFGLHPKEVYVCSTGKIGEYLPMPHLLKGLKTAKGDLSEKNFLEATKGIMTTDQYPKFDLVRGRILGEDYTIAVLAKGAGMLRPNMATMLAFVVTDLRLNRATLKSIFREAVDKTLNRVTVDGDTSTNDTVLMMANGRAGNALFSAKSAEGIKIKNELTRLLENMARQIALDGEGATKCCDVVVSGARNREDAKKVAYAIGNSPLVKTALFGCDPNWGRIMAAIGYSGAHVVQNKINIEMGSYQLVLKGESSGKFSPDEVSRYLKNKNITMKVNLGLGRGNFHVYMSDLTYDYIHLNAEYHT